MTVNPLAIVSQTPAAQDLRRRVEAGGALSLTGVSAGAQPFLAAWLHTLFPSRPLIVVTEGLKAQESFQQDLETWLGAGGTGPDAAPESKVARPLFFPAWEVLPHESKLPHADVVSERLETLVALGRKATHPASIVVTTVTALMQLTFPTGLLAKRTRVLKRGDREDPLDLVEWLEAQGHEPEAQVTQKGDIALRGGILDVYPLTSPWPVRLEFFGDELESLRYFDPITQVSREEITQVTLPPGGEIGILKRLVEEAGEEPASRPGPRPELATLLDHLPADAIFLLCEPEALAEHAMTYGVQIPDDDAFHLEWFEFRARLQAGKITTIEARELTALDKAFAQEGEPDGQGSSTDDSESPAELVPRSPPAGAETFSILHPYTVELAFPSLDAYRPLAERAVDPQVAETQRREFFAQVHRWLRQGYQVRVFCNNAGERQRFGEIWAEYGFSGEVKARRSGGEEAPAPAAFAMLEPGLFTQVGSLTRGFLSDEAKLVVVTDAEIFGRYKMQRPRRLKGPHAAATRSALDIDFTELEEGDLVVHLQHGIGRYAGLQVMPTGSGRKGPDGAQRALTTEEGQECIVIEYAPADPAQPPPKLYVPVTESHLVSKYIGAGKARPQLNTLGGTKWTKAKAHAEHAVRDLASELLSIQAARETQSGYSFGADTPWQREFESSFFYEETPDQIKAIDASKKDMESARPMDRLICGDVGFGKTEVAIRAAFKAVMGGKQVAVLVPTTVLAQQHYNNLRERMADYPIRVDLLSRFRSRREQTKVIEDLAAGAVDIVIGTHRLVQKDVTFKDLGLVVIDEEQRFGVMHKEKFKLLRKMVDVLTLSATPIPRTLYLALTGARDMSTLETPPQDRLPIQTIVTQYDERIIREAIQRELNRGGQVFFLHNRVTTIDAMALKLKALLPNARLVIGHGQMDPDDLERVMTQFVNGEADVLLSTTIIESGLDIPNANTIIIDRADRFGLSELYQLRGRVGRYKHQAYAYLLIPRHARMLTDARKRISAIKQYSTLGSGFKIAMRDLEIRGAGNLLGSQQSGHITAVGFDLYCQLLKQSVAVLKGEKVKRRIEVAARFDFLALSPEEETRPPEPAVDRAPKRAKFKINIPRETAAFSDDDDDEPVAAKAAERPREIAPAYLPLNYVNEPKHRIEIYRKLAQISDKPALDALQKEVRDRFGKLPESVDLLWQVAELKLLAGERGITNVEVKEDRVMLTRNNDYIQVGGKFPRLGKKEPAARLKEIKRLLLVL